MKLFEIVKEIANCIKRVDSDDYINVESGEIIDTEALDALKVERDVKIENIGKWILNLEAEEKALAEQEQRFAEMQVGRFLDWQAKLEQHLGEVAFNERLADELVEKIMVSEQGSVEIRFACDDVCSYVAELLGDGGTE
jgi:hypothetical protein